MTRARCRVPRHVIQRNRRTEFEVQKPKGSHALRRQRLIATHVGLRIHERSWSKVIRRTTRSMCKRAFPSNFWAGRVTSVRSLDCAQLEVPVSQIYLPSFWLHLNWPRFIRAVTCRSRSQLGCALWTDPVHHHQFIFHSALSSEFG